ncbi:hypothetical protein Bbelb_250990 [Branchiostoma belcheri]|nr:hypothetical protein Bbelb_250990 [Branchiostoma belcheri]
MSYSKRDDDTPRRVPACQRLLKHAANPTSFTGQTHSSRFRGEKYFSANVEFQPARGYLNTQLALQASRVKLTAQGFTERNVSARMFACCATSYYECHSVVTNSTAQTHRSTGEKYFSARMLVKDRRRECRTVKDVAIPQSVVSEMLVVSCHSLFQNIARICDIKTVRSPTMNVTLSLQTPQYKLTELKVSPKKYLSARMLVKDLRRECRTVKDMARPTERE